MKLRLAPLVLYVNIINEFFKPPQTIAPCGHFAEHEPYDARTKFSVERVKGIEPSS